MSKKKLIEDYEYKGWFVKIFGDYKENRVDDQYLYTERYDHPTVAISIEVVKNKTDVYTYADKYFYKICEACTRKESQGWFKKAKKIEYTLYEDVLYNLAEMKANAHNEIEKMNFKENIRNMDQKMTDGLLDNIKNL